MVWRYCRQDLLWNDSSYSVGLLGWGLSDWPFLKFTRDKKVVNFLTSIIFELCSNYSEITDIDSEEYVSSEKKEQRLPSVTNLTFPCVVTKETTLCLFGFILVFLQLALKLGLPFKEFLHHALWVSPSGPWYTECPSTFFMLPFYQSLRELPTFLIECVLLCASLSVTPVS